MTPLDDTIAELTTLTEALDGALARDNIPGTGHTFGNGAVYNPDVMYALDTLHREVPATSRDAYRAIREPWQPRDLPTTLRQIPRLAGRLHDLGMVTEQKRLEDAARRWLRLTKRALGLIEPDDSIGWPCPYHEAPLTDLVSAGAESFLNVSPSGSTVTTIHAARIYCPACGASWDVGQWRMLGKMLEESALWARATGRYPRRRCIRRAAAIHDPHLGIRWRAHPPRQRRPRPHPLRPRSSRRGGSPTRRQHPPA